MLRASMLVLLASCGARTDLGIEVTAMDASCTLPSPPDTSCIPGTPPPSTSCGPLHMKIGLAESCALTNPTCQPIDLVGRAPFTCPISNATCANTGPSPQAVLALNRWGAGHVAAFCDSTNLAQIATSRMLTYLGRVATPRVAGIGTFPCDGGSLAATYIGKGLPPRYVGDAKLFADDWDVVVLCGSGISGVTGTTYGPIHIEWATTFRHFVHDFGKGLLIAADYARNCGSPPDLYDAINAITAPAGISFSVVDLGYSTMTADSDCVPDFPP